VVLPQASNINRDHEGEPSCFFFTELARALDFTNDYILIPAKNKL